MDYIGRALERACLRRERFVEDKVPSSLSGLVVVPFFGDIRSEFIFSTMLLPQFKQQNPSAYLAVCSWPGHFGLYPYADEYWSLTDEASLASFAKDANGFANKKALVCERTLLRYFDQVSPDIVASYYKNGLTSQYLEACQDVFYTLPSIPSVNMRQGRGPIQVSGKMIFLSPVQQMVFWKHRQQESHGVSRIFWIDLCNKLVAKGYTPVLYQNYATYDLSEDMENACVYLTDQNLLAVLGVMRACECVVDVFSGISRYAYVARTPAIICDDRQRYSDLKEYEIDDLCGKDIPKKYIFSFVPIVANDSRQILIDAIVNKLDNFLSEINRDQLPSTVEFSKRMSYSCVRKKQLKRMGARFINPPHRENDS